MNILENLEPKLVFKHFESLTKIPRASFKEKMVSDFILNWAKSLNLESFQDELYNLIIKKPASKGYENSPSVILQGHLDMVCEKNNDTQFDFDNQGLEIYIDGDYIKAKGTTLGADNGVAVAYAMAILEDNSIEHPPIEVVLTTVEEAGMDGAKGIDASILNSKLFINLDSEDEGVFLSSCSGGLKAQTIIDIEFENIDNLSSYQISIFGLRGGHSGMDIDKGRANANRILGRLLSSFDSSFYISHIEGGSKDNAITREAFANISIKDSDFEKISNEIKNMESIFKNEYSNIEPNLSISFKKINNESKAFSLSISKKIANILTSLPYGPYTYSKSLPGLVESSNNIGTIKIENNKIIITNAVRSSIDSRAYEIGNIIKSISSMANVGFKQSDFYPGWQYVENSKLRDSFVNSYRNLYKKEPKILAIHAGVECGIFAKKIDGLDMISLGPNMHDVHTPDEKLSISSTKNVYEFLLYALKDLK